MINQTVNLKITHDTQNVFYYEKNFRYYLSVFIVCIS